MDIKDVWLYYHDEARDQIDPAMVMKTVESICSTPGLKLGQTWVSYLTELPKLPWTTIFLTSLKLERYDEDMKECVLYALCYCPCGLKTNDFSNVEIHNVVTCTTLAENVACQA